MLWLTPDVLCHYLGISYSHTHRLCQRGVFPSALKRNRRWYVPVEDADAWKENEFEKRLKKRIAVPGHKEPVEWNPNDPCPSPCPWLDAYDIDCLDAGCYAAKEKGLSND